ncbi:MAG: hypothetical protein J0I17_05980 ['Candidatus Kapabacteria' thiocyanatum]|nr:hypothetical protein ['Candidatus Kapabacteria' thiocyanatum]
MMSRWLIRSLVLLLACTSMTAQRWKLLFPYQSYTIQINALNPDHLYVGNWANQLLRSYDAGKSWEIVPIGSLAAENYLTSMVVSATDTNVIVIGGYQFDGIRRSDDGGRTWKRALNDTNNIRMWYVSEAIVEDPASPGRMFAARGAGSNAFYRSDDYGATWDSIGTVGKDITTRICTMALRPDSTNIIFLGCIGGRILRSDDGGQTFHPTEVAPGKTTLFPDSEIPKIVFSSTDPRRGYAVSAIANELNITGNGGILQTTDGGATWRQTAGVDTSWWAVDVRPAANGVDDDIIVGGFRLFTQETIIKGDSIVMRSPDGGKTWTRFEGIPWGTNEVGDTIRNVWSIRWDSIGRRLYMCTSVGLYVLDESVGVDERPSTPSTLQARYADGTLILIDTAPNDQERTWSIFGIDGRLAMSGELQPGIGERTIPCGALANGRYVIVLNAERRFRTAPFTILR